MNQAPARFFTPQALFTAGFNLRRAEVLQQEEREHAGEIALLERNIIEATQAGKLIPYKRWGNRDAKP
jgi:hypothetical protein